MLKLTELCPVCGGKGKFLDSKCSKCAGSGGKIIPFDARFKFYLEPHLKTLAEQERAVLDLYLEHFTQAEIAQKIDISKHSVLFILHNIEKKINKANETA